MDKTKKILLVVFATLLVMNLQFNTPLTKGMNDGFSLSQLVENVFVQESYAENPRVETVICTHTDGIYHMDCINPGDVECRCNW
jgi:hypothetical protein